MTITVRRAEKSDAQPLALVGAATFLESYAGVIDGAALVRHCATRHTAEFYAAALADSAQALWLAEIDRAPVGYLHLTPPDLPVELSEADLEIKRIYVLSSLHRTGLGRRLLGEAEACARRAGADRLLLGVYKENARALAFYERVGFEIAGERAFDVGGVAYQDWVLAKSV
ncbi:MAG: GNAT family N-acetyltransferase [Oceanicaulis sp.]